jgi:hypothetical protein
LTDDSLAPAAWLPLVCFAYSDGISAPIGERMKNETPPFVEHMRKLEAEWDERQKSK